MKEYILNITISLVLGFFLGNFLVYLFNKMPISWISEYQEERKEEDRKYLKSIPYKYVFSGVFICSLIYLSFNYDILYSLLVSITLFMLILLSICDIKYMIVPDELIILLLVTGIGYIKYHSLKDMLFGLLAGFIISITIFLLSKFIFKKVGLGGGDIKLYTTLGFLTGLKGIIFIFLLTTIISGLTFLIELILKRSKFTDEKPIVPYIMLSSAIYLFGANTIISKVVINL